MFLGTNYFLIWLDAIEMVFFRAEVFIVWFYSMTLGVSSKYLYHHRSHPAYHLSDTVCLVSALAYTSSFLWQRNLHVLEGLISPPALGSMDLTEAGLAPAVAPKFF